MLERLGIATGDGQDGPGTAGHPRGNHDARHHVLAFEQLLQERRQIVETELDGLVEPERLVERDLVETVANRMRRAGGQQRRQSGPVTPARSTSSDRRTRKRAETPAGEKRDARIPKAAANDGAMSKSETVSWSGPSTTGTTSGWYGPFPVSRPSPALPASLSPKCFDAKGEEREGGRPRNRDGAPTRARYPRAARGLGTSRASRLGPLQRPAIA